MTATCHPGDPRPTTVPHVPSDERLPHLELALDVGRVSRLIGDGLGVSATADVAYLRYKPGTRCLILYEVRSAGRPVAQVYGRVSSPSGPPDVVPSGGWAAPGLPIVFVPAQADRRVRGLRCLSSPTGRAALLAHLVRAANRDQYVEGWGSWRTERYKPERRAVLSGVRADGAPYFVRLYAEREGERTAETVRALRHTLPAARALGNGLRYSHSFRALLTGHAPGVPLSTLSPAERLPGLRNAAEAIGQLHDLPPTDCLARRRDAVWPLRRSVDALAALSVDAGAEAGGVATAVIDRLGAAERPECLIHGDYDASQVLVGPAHEVHLIDFDETCRGTAVEDVAGFMARLVGRAGPDADVVRLAETHAMTFFDVYQSRARVPLSPGQVRAWMARALLQVAVEPFKRFDQDWPDRMRQIVRQATLVLEGRLC